MRMFAVVVSCTLLGAAPSAAQVEGRAVFEGKGNCHACHGRDATGTPLAPSLADSVWLNVDGTRESIIATIESGVPKPVQHPAPMPPMGGASLSRAEIEALADYILSLATKTGGR